MPGHLTPQPLCDWLSPLPDAAVPPDFMSVGEEEVPESYQANDIVFHSSILHNELLQTH